MTANTAAGYSGTPLWKKLGIKPGSRLLTAGARADYRGLIAPLPDGATLVERAGTGVDLAHIFVTREADMHKQLRALRKKLEPEVPVWVSWPKKSAGLATDITEHTIRSVALPLGFVDIKVCAVSEVWSALKLVVRKELR